MTVSLLRDNTQLTVNPTTLTFSADDNAANAWNKPQLVTVSAFDDLLLEGIHYWRISHQITSSLNSFFGLSLNDVAAGLTGSITATARNSSKPQSPAPPSPSLRIPRSPPTSPCRRVNLL